MNFNRNSIQTLIKVLLVSIIIFSEYFPLILTAYFALIFSILETYNYISAKESSKEISYDKEDNKMIHQKNNSLGFPALLFTVVIQLLSLAAVFLLTWYVLEKKIKYFN